jgi:serine/threonine protein kinase
MHRPLEQIDQVRTGILKIVDYGHSRTLPSAAQLNPGVLTANDRGTELYRAPETIASKSRSAQYSTKVDIFSTGLICWELWHRELPFASLKHKHMRRIEELIKEGERPEIDDDCPPGLASLIRWCWQPDPALRFVALLTRALVLLLCVGRCQPALRPLFTSVWSTFHPLPARRLIFTRKIVPFSPARHPLFPANHPIASFTSHTQTPSLANSALGNPQTAPDW